MVLDLDICTSACCLVGVASVGIGVMRLKAKYGNDIASVDLCLYGVVLLLQFITVQSATRTDCD